MNWGSLSRKSRDFSTLPTNDMMMPGSDIDDLGGSGEMGGGMGSTQYEMTLFSDDDDDAAAFDMTAPSGAVGSIDADDIDFALSGGGGGHGKEDDEEDEYDEYDDDESLVGREGGRVRSMGWRGGGRRAVTEGDSNQYDVVSRCLGGPCAQLFAGTRGRRAATLLIFAIVVAICGYQVTLLRPAHGIPVLFPKHHNVRERETRNKQERRTENGEQRIERRFPSVLHVLITMDMRRVVSVSRVYACVAHRIKHIFPPRRVLSSTTFIIFFSTFDDLIRFSGSWTSWPTSLATKPATSAPRSTTPASSVTA